MSANPEDLLRIVGTICGGIFLLAFAAGSVFLILSYFKNKKKAAASLTWSTTPGTILESTVRESRSSDDDRPSTYYAQVNYSYQVMGQAYQGKNIHIGARNTGPHSKAQAIASRYPAGSSVTVYYDPANPADAVLERAAPANTVTLILGIIFLVITLCLMCGGLFAVINTFTATTGS
ncbi:MAG: DUF3592 domain-containing protein [Anaerolineaceae bacterium]|nr:DUF3592 domain-containing protein [Anaerolineaceae bacterium]